MLSWLIDLVLHLDRHLVEMLAQYHFWIYPILFAVIFAETGLVVTPFLPGDSLLFAVGALAAVDTSGTLNTPLLNVLLGGAAILGNTTNYADRAAHRTARLQRAVPAAESRASAAHGAILRTLRRPRRRAVALHADRAYFCAVRGGRRSHALRAASRPTTCSVASAG